MAKTNYRKNHAETEDREHSAVSSKPKPVILQYKYHGTFGKVERWTKWKAYPNLKAAHSALQSLSKNKYLGYEYRILE